MFIDTGCPELEGAGQHGSNRTEIAFKGAEIQEFE
jgi:hypothetical protein